MPGQASEKYGWKYYITATNDRQHSELLRDTYGAQYPSVRFWVQDDKNINQGKKFGRWGVWADQQVGPSAEGEAGTGEADGGGPSPTSGPGMTPTMANPPTPGPGGQGFQIGANQVLLDLPSLQGDWGGLETLVPDNRLPIHKSPRVTNWDRFGRYGSRCVRRGVVKLIDDIRTVHDGAQAQALMTLIQQADYAADTDWFQFITPAGVTHAFWLDTTGSDTVPAAADGADNTYQVDISSATTAAQVAALVHAAINTAAIGVASFDNMDGTLLLNVTSGGAFWRLEEFVTDANFEVVTFAAFAGTALTSEYRGLGLLSLPCGDGTADHLLMAFRDKDVSIGGVPNGQSVTSLHVMDTGPTAGRPWSLDGMRGPDFKLSNPSGTVIRVTAAYPAIPQTSLQKQTVKAITIRYRGPYTDAAKHYPLDPDESTQRSTVLVIRDDWDGESKQFNTPSLAVGRWFFAVWCHSLEGSTDIAKGSLTLT